MSNSIDELQIEINAQAVKANDAIDKLVGKLDRLTGYLNRLDVSKLGTLSNGFQKLGTSMQMINSTKTADFSRLAKNLQSLNDIDTSKLTNLSANIKNISKAFSGLKGAKEITELASGIKQLGYKSSDKAITNIPLLADAMKKLMKELSTAPKVSRNIIDMTNALAKLARTGSSSGKVANSISKSFNQISKSSIRTSGNIVNLSKKFKGLFKSILPFVGIWKLFDFGKQSIEISSDLTEVQNVVDTTFGNFNNKIEELSKVSIPEIGMSELTTKQIASRYQAMGIAMGITQDSMADMSVELTRLAGDMASFYNVEQKAVGEDLESIFTGQTKPLRQYGLDLTEATLQEWALKNGIDANINSMSQMEKTILRYKYVLANTQAAHGDFLKTQDTWANQTRILSQQIKQLASVIGGTLINALKPLVIALNAAMKNIIAFAQVISDALGKIFGWTYQSGGGFTLEDDFSGASDYSEDIADSTGKAAKNIKEMKAGLRAFDELKTININDNKNGSGGGAGGSISEGFGSKGFWTESEKLPFESTIDNLYKLGKKISEALIGAMDSINWNEVYEKARGFGKGLAIFLNGLFTGQNGKTLFGEIGKTIASALNSVIYETLSFGENFDFTQFGNNIADGINNFFSTFDFSSLAKTLNVWVSGIVDIIKTLISEIEWGSVFEGFAELLSNLDLDTGIFLAFISAPLLKNAFDDAIKGLGALKLTLPPIEFEGLGAGIGSMSSEVLALTGLLTALAAGLTYVFVTNEDVRNGFLNSVNAIKEGLQPSIQFLTDTVLPNLNSGFNTIIEILSPLSEFLIGAFTSVWTEVINPLLENVGTSLLPGLSEAFQSLWNNVLVPLGQFLSEVLEPAFKVVADIMTILWNNVVIPLAGAFVDVLFPALDLAIQIFKKVCEWIKPVIDTLTFLWKNVLMPIVSFLLAVFKPIFEKVFKIIGGIINAFGKVLGGLITFVSGIFSNDWEKAWEGVKSIFTGIFNGLISIFEGVVNAIIGGINVFIKGFNGIATDVGDIIGIDITIPVIQEVKLQRFETGGFPEDGWFRASQGEIMGKFDNGKSVVANNQQITEGISNAVYQGNRELVFLMQQDLSETRRQNEILNGILQKETGISYKDVFEAARRGANEYVNRTGRKPFPY